MNKLMIVAKNELIRYFISPLAYVYLISFLLLNGSFAIYFGNFFERGNADLITMFMYQPWLYLLFIPGISMRLWAEEFRNKTVVQMVTMPVSITELVWGKFLASWAFCALALVLTFPFWITVNYLGSPDNMVIAMSYVASFIVAGCMLAISQTMSALTKNQVIALVLAVIANLIFFMSGLEYVLAFFRLFAPLPIIDMIASFSFITHFNNMIAGLIELRDGVFFVSLIVLFNFTTVLAVSFKTAGTSRFLKSSERGYFAIIFALLLMGFVGLNLLANNLLRDVQYDFTEEKLFTVTEPTKRVLQNIKEPVTVKIYYSKILEQRNPDLRQMFDKIRILMRKYASLSKGKFDYKIYDPEVLSEVEDIALAAGLQPFPIVDLNRNAYFGLTVTDDLDNRKVIPFFAPERLSFLEQDITEKIYALSHQKKTVGILTSLSLFDKIQENNVVTQKWEIINQIEEFYDVKIINKPEDIAGIDVLMIVHPQGLATEMVQEIKNYTLAGGKILAFSDVAAEAPRIYSPENNDLNPSEWAGLDELWGFRFNNEVVVADLVNSITVDVTNNYKTNLTFTQDVLQFILKPNNFNHRVKETEQIKGVLLASAGIIEPLYNNSQLSFIPLMKTSIVSELMPAMAAQRNIEPTVILQKFKPDTKEKIVAAKVLSLDKAHPFEVIAVADSDMLYDTFWAKSQVILDTTYIIPLLDNANFVMNALDSLSGGENLIGLRGKSAAKRPFSKLERLRKTNEQAFKAKEAEIFQRVDVVKKDLQEIWSKKNFEERENFNADELAVIAGVRKKLEALRDELVEIKNNINHEIKKTDMMVKFFNIYFMSLLIALLLVVYAVLKSRHNLNFSWQLRFDKSLVIMTTVVASLLALGSLSVYYADGSEIEKYENKLVFPELFKDINEVAQINIKNHDNELNLYKESGVWKLQNPANLPVYQERIRSFLSSLIEARYFERKTANAEYLSRFGLSPIEKANSKNTRIELKNAAGKVITAFEVGKYDVDIGRGAKAAYVKFDNKFQVWLIAADFVDLSTKWQEWTYANLWNLRFGRLSGYNNEKDKNWIMMLMKQLLNTPMQQESKVIANPKLQFEINLEVEQNNQVEIQFFKSKDGKSWVKYNFIRVENNNHLQFFESYVNDKFYEISAPNMEKIENVIKPRK